MLCAPVTYEADAREIPGGIAGLFHRSIATEVRAESGLEQHTARQRRRPFDLLHALEAVAVPTGRAAGQRAAGLGRDRRRAVVDEARCRLHAATVLVLAVRCPKARDLLVPEQADVVARRRLNRQPQVLDLIRLSAPRLARRVGQV